MIVDAKGRGVRGTMIRINSMENTPLPLKGGFPRGHLRGLRYVLASPGYISLLVQFAPPPAIRETDLQASCFGPAITFLLTLYIFPSCSPLLHPFLARVNSFTPFPLPFLPLCTIIPKGGREGGRGDENSRYDLSVWVRGPW